MDKNSRIFSIILISIAVFISYSNSFDCSFQFDDVHSIQQNSYVRDISKFADLGYWFDLYNRAPAQFTLAMNYSISQNDVFGYHLINSIIHFINSFLVFILIGILIDSDTVKKGYIKENKRIIQLFTAFIFAVHPIQTQSVTYIIQRMESQAGMFYLTALIFYIIAKNAKRRKIISYVLFIISGLIAVLTKQTSFSLPLSLILLEIFFIRNDNGKFNIKIIYSIIGVLVLTAIVMAVTNTLPRETSDISRYQYLLSQLTIIPKYIFMSFIPVGQTIDHYVILPESLFTYKVAGGMILIVGLITSAVFLYKKNKLVSFSICWFFSLLLLRSSILPINDLMYEHRLYMPVISIGLLIPICIIFITEKLDLRKINKYFPVVILSMITITYSVTTYQRNKVWKTDISLWADAVKKSPEKFRPNYNLAEALKRNGYSDKALTFYLKAHSINSESYVTLNNIGNIYYAKKDIVKAKKFYESAIDINPDYPKTLNNLANIYLSEKKYPEAEVLYLKALKLKPDYIDALFNSGNLYYLTGRKEQALENYKKIIQLKPDHKGAKDNYNALKPKN